jgi:hypothetical protein
MTYQDLEKQYPNKEIKLIPSEYLSQYEGWGFECIHSWTEKSSVTGENVGNYCFVIETK